MSSLSGISKRAPSRCGLLSLGATGRLGEAEPPQCVTQASPDSEACNKNLTDSVDVFGFVQREYCKHNLWLTLIKLIAVPACCK